MAKSQQKSQTKRQAPAPAGSKLDFFNSEKPQTMLILLGIVLFAILLFFREGVFGGKIFASADNLVPLTYRPFLEDAQQQGIFPLWLPYIFMGMPSLASLTVEIQSLQPIIAFIWNGFINFLSGGNLFFRTLFYYFIFGINVFFFARFKFRNNLIALFASLLSVFATGIIQLIIVGHHTKMMTFAFFPLILLLIERIISGEEENRFRILLDFSVLAIVLYIQLQFHHVQMLFYSYMMIGIYVLYLLVYNLLTGIKVRQVVKALSLFIAAVLIALAMDADMIMSIKEYNKYSMRGESSILTKAEDNASEKPLSYDYATNWSFSPGEMITFVVPYYYGFGNVEVKGQRANLYWGQMPFTDSPVYFGVIVLVLSIIGAFFNFRRNPFVQATVVIIMFFMLLSFGRTFPVIYDLFYNYMPYFSSFRAPVMIHYYIDLAFVLLAAYGLHTMVRSLKEAVSEKKLEKAAYFVLASGIILLLISFAGFESSYTNSVSSGPLADKLRMQTDNPQQIAGYTKQIAALAYENVISDLRLHGFLILILGGILYAYVKRKMAASLALVSVLVLGLVDLLNVSSKTLHWDDKSQKESFFREADFTRWLLAKEPETYRYRVAQFSKGSLVTSNELAYFRLHCFNGYHGAKIRIYQDAVDVAGGSNPFLLGLANVKYILSDSPLKDTVSYTEVYKGSNIVYENKFFMPRAFFAEDYKVENGINILNNIGTASFNPYKTAYLEKEPSVKVDKPDSTSYARITSFNFNEIKYEVSSAGNNLLILNEIYYPAGWKAYIDGAETEIMKTNYLLRSVIVPEGKHEILMKFYPETYYTGRNISTASNVIAGLLLLGGIAGILITRSKHKQEK